jgi:hypothetical protein
MACLKVLFENLICDEITTSLNSVAIHSRQYLPSGKDETGWPAIWHSFHKIINSLHIVTTGH